MSYNTLDSSMNGSCQVIYGNLHSIIAHLAQVILNTLDVPD